MYTYICAYIYVYVYAYAYAYKYIHMYTYIYFRSMVEEVFSMSCRLNKPIRFLHPEYYFCPVSLEHFSKKRHASLD